MWWRAVENGGCFQAVQKMKEEGGFRTLPERYPEEYSRLLRTMKPQQAVFALGKLDKTHRKTLEEKEPLVLDEDEDEDVVACETENAAKATEAQWQRALPGEQLRRGQHFSMLDGDEPDGDADGLEPLVLDDEDDEGQVQQELDENMEKGDGLSPKVTTTQPPYP